MKIKEFTVVTFALLCVVRCIRVTETEPVDPVLARVAKACNLNLRNLGLPAEFTLWIDPHDVTCRYAN